MIRTASDNFSILKINSKVIQTSINCEEKNILALV